MTHEYIDTDEVSPASVYYDDRGLNLTPEALEAVLGTNPELLSAQAFALYQRKGEIKGVKYGNHKGVYGVSKTPTVDIVIHYRIPEYEGESTREALEVALKADKQERLAQQIKQKEELIASKNAELEALQAMIDELEA